MGCSGWRVKLSTCLHLVPKLRMIGAILLHSIYAIMLWAKLILPSAVPVTDAAIKFYISLFFFEHIWMDKQTSKLKAET